MPHKSKVELCMKTSLTFKYLQCFRFKKVVKNAFIFKFSLKFEDNFNAIVMATSTVLSGTGCLLFKIPEGQAPGLCLDQK